jgi:acyl dehydratase
MIETGHSFERRVRWTRDDIVEFASLVGDKNPLHHDDAYAAQTRFGSLIASGAQAVAVLMAMCGSQATKDTPGVGLEFNFRLLGPARVDDEILLRWEVVAVEASERPRGTVVSLKGEALGGDGRAIVSATAKTLYVPSL